jgi:sugar phosphate permease
MRKLYYGWIVVLITFLALLISSGVRTAPSVIIKPLEADFGWDRASISFAFAISLFAFGFGAPIGGSLVDRLGPRRVMLTGLGLTVVGLLPLLSMSELWQLHLFWGLLVGVGTGMVTNVLGATVALRWFNQYRGVVVGIFGAASAAGQLLFVPALIALVTAAGWQTGIGVVAVVVGITVVPVLIFMRNRPEDMNLKPLGEPTLVTAKVDARKTTLREAVRTRDFWLLTGSYFRVRLYNQRPDRDTFTTAFTGTRFC